MATHRELKAQAEALLQQKEVARRAEITTVMAEIKSRMKEYGIVLSRLISFGGRYLSLLFMAKIPGRTAPFFLLAIAHSGIFPDYF